MLCCTISLHPIIKCLYGTETKENKQAYDFFNFNLIRLCIFVCLLLILLHWAADMQHFYTIPIIYESAGNCLNNYNKSPAMLIFKEIEWQVVCDIHLHPLLLWKLSEVPAL